MQPDELDSLLGRARVVGLSFEKPQQKSAWFKTIPLIANPARKVRRFFIGALDFRLQAKGLKVATDPAS
jgi:hypothetical protein